MLPPDARSLLVDALRPPPGSTLSRAIALTFTLDLESLLVAPLAFAAHAIRESTDPIAVMDGVRRCADRIDVFCQAGQIVVPSGSSTLLAFVEPMVHEVRRPRPGRLFHPKLWVLRFLDEVAQTSSVRLLVLSRNLTNDRSWDTCLRLDGTVGNRPYASNRPLFDLIQQAHDLAVHPLEPGRRAAVQALTEDLRRAEWEPPEDVRDIVFYALGLPRAPLPVFTGTRHLVVSPFCTDAGLARSTPGGGGTVVGRQEELDRLPEGSLDGYEVMVVSELAGLSAEDSPADRDILTGLHAKLYVVEKGQTARVLLGSANATDAAFGGNVEFLVELVGPRSRLGIDTMIGSSAAFRAILEPYERRDVPERDDELALLDLVRDIAATPMVATVSRDADSFAVHLGSADPLPTVDDVRLTAQLHTRRGDTVDLLGGRPVDARFAELALVDITPFVVVTAEDRHGGRARTVLLAQLVGDPAERLDHVLAQQVDSPEKFLRFLLLLLGLGTGDGTLEAGLATGNGAWLVGNGAGILELLVTALADRPQQLDDLARLVERIQSTDSGRTILPEGFPELWRTVDEARRRVLA